MATIRGGAIAGALALVFVSRIAAADPAASCQPACESGQVCVDGACAPAPANSAPAAEGTPKLATPVAARVAAPPPAWHEGFLVIPNVGINSFQGDAGSGAGIGLRAGVLAGSRMGENWSLNVGAAFDLMNLNPPPGATGSGYVFDLGFDPLFHLPLPQPKLEVIAGPVLGTFVQYGHGSALGISADTWSYGWTLGLNAGVLFSVGASAKLGVLANFFLREPMKSCVSIGGGTETCSSDMLDSNKTLAFTAAAMF